MTARHIPQLTIEATSQLTMYVCIVLHLRSVFKEQEAYQSVSVALMACPLLANAEQER